MFTFGGRACRGCRPLARADGVELEEEASGGGCRFARRYGCGESFAKVALESVRLLLLFGVVVVVAAAIAPLRAGFEAS